MRRYRYGDPSKFAIKRFSTYAYIFLSWNLLGFVAFKIWKMKKEASNPEWKELSSTEKYLSMMSLSKNIERVKISGLKIDEKKQTSSTVE